MPTLTTLAWPVRTERLVIRPAQGADLAEMWEYRRLPQVNRWMTAGASPLAEFVDRHGDEEVLARTLALEEAGHLVGDLYLAVEDAWAQREVREVAHDSQAEIGWCLAPAAQGRGLATEAVRALLHLCLTPPPAGLGLRRVIANCFAANEPSWRLMERLGLRREAHHVRDSLHRDGQWYDGYTYALLAEELTP